MARSALEEVPFKPDTTCRLFPGLSPWSPMISAHPSEREIEAHFLKISCEEMIEDIPRTTGFAEQPTEMEPPHAGNAGQFLSAVPAGYTFFAQFIDHDLSYCPPAGQLRQPRLHLDGLYGGGIMASPWLYEPEGNGRLLVDCLPDDNGFDLPRNRVGTALVGDPRNDANAVLAALHVAFARAHNTLLKRAEHLSPAAPFDHARRTLRWLYQHILWHDFIRRLTSEHIFDAALHVDRTRDGRQVWRSAFDDLRSSASTQSVPVEFRLAGSWFAQSMVRDTYRLNERGDEVTVCDRKATDRTADNRAIDWALFLPLHDGPAEGPQMGRKIGPTLCRRLATFPAGGGLESILAFRNLMRAWRSGLPAGSDVARRLGHRPLSMEQDRDCLWLYILNEASQPGNDGNRLGPVGSTIVAATVAHVLLGDNESQLRLAPAWHPDQASLLCKSDNRDSTDGRWGLASVIRLADEDVTH